MVGELGEQDPSAQAARSARPAPPGLLPLPASRSFLSLEVGPGRIGRRWDMSGRPRTTDLNWAGRRVEAPQPAQEYLPAPAAYLFCSGVRPRRLVCFIS